MRLKDLQGSPQDWIKRARSNLARAKIPRTDEILLEDLCFDAQQAAEKAIKALLISKKITFRFVHDIAELLTVLEKSGVTIPEKVRVSATLTPYAVETRYPGPFEQVTQVELTEAVAIADEVLKWAETEILSASSPLPFQNQSVKSDDE